MFHNVIMTGRPIAWENLDKNSNKYATNIRGDSFLGNTRNTRMQQ